MKKDIETWNEKGLGIQVSDEQETAYPTYVQKANTLREIEVEEMHVKILLTEGNVKYLGQVITFVDQETIEVQHKTRCAWSAFARHRQELTTQVAHL